jgi:AcrR family transcriptional regulator
MILRAVPAHPPQRKAARRERGEAQPKLADATAAPRRTRLATADRERQIVAGAIRFFSDRGLDGQLRDLARNIGVTHTLLYHYFPTKQALIDRVYLQLFEGMWKAEWEQILDDPTLDVQTKFERFYCDYARALFSRELVRILVFSGLSDHYIPDRFFELLRNRLFPRLIRETRRHCGVTSRAKPSARELEFLMGLHGGIFYIGLRRSVYEQSVHGAEASEYDETYICDRIKGYLLSAQAVLYAPLETVEPSTSRVLKSRRA